MRSVSTRAAVHSGAAVGVAVIWGAVECVALLWSRLNRWSPRRHRVHQL